jgi:hypothetical protein
VVAGSAEPVLETKSKTLWIYGGVAILVAVDVIVGVTVGATVGKPDTQTPKPTTAVPSLPTDQPSISPFKPTNKPSHPPSMTPTKEPSASPNETSQFDLFLDKFIAQKPSLELEVFRNTSTPQHQTLTWLAEDDGMALDTETSPFALERFILATLFFLQVVSTGEISTSFYSQEHFLNGRMVIPFFPSGFVAMNEAKFRRQAWVSS